MHEGTVRWFDDEKGYGFIAPRDGTADVFVHYTGIEGTGRRSLRGASREQRADLVEFDLEPDEKGRMQAVRVRVIDVFSDAPASA